MTLWRITDKRMNCLITQEEIQALGYDLSDITQNRERTQEFLNLLLEKGRDALGIDISNGIQSFYGAFLPDDSLLLSISCADIEEELAEFEQQERHPIPLLTEDGEACYSFQIMFDSLEHVISFCEVFDKGKASGSRLYKYDEMYYLMLDFEESEAGKLASVGVVTAEEFDGMVESQFVSEVFLKEHEACMIEEDAVGKLCDLNG